MYYSDEVFRCGMDIKVSDGYGNKMENTADSNSTGDISVGISNSERNFDGLICATGGTAAKPTDQKLHYIDLSGTYLLDLEKSAQEVR